MYIYVTFAVLPFVAHIVSCESTKEPPKNIQAKTSFKKQTVEAATSEVPYNALIRRSLGDKTPTVHSSIQPIVWGENKESYNVLRMSPHSLTKLAKTLSLGFDPSFSKDYFEPFERRPRPVTLVTFRKKGLALRKTVNLVEGNEVAEQQSPFNEVSNFWQNDEAYQL